MQIVSALGCAPPSDHLSSTLELRERRELAAAGSRPAAT